MFLVAMFIVRDKLLKQRTSAVGTDCHPTLVTILPIYEYFYSKISILQYFCNNE